MKAKAPSVTVVFLTITLCVGVVGDSGRAGGATSVDVLEFLLAPGSDCVRPSETVTVELYQRDLDQLVRGFQAFAQFDSSAMTHNSTTFTAWPYGQVLLDSVSGDDIDLAAGIDDLGGQSPTMDDALLVTLEFTAGATEGLTNVSFRYHEPPSRFTDELGGEVVPCLVDSPTIVIDGTDPVIACPPNVFVRYDESTDPSNTGTATATDNLDPAPTITFSDNITPGPCPQESVITRTWTATDCAENSDSCDQIITVLPETASVNVLEFLPAPGSDCVRPGETVTVELYQRGLEQFVRGFQAFAQFDSSAMTHSSTTFTPWPYGQEILSSVSGDDIDLAAGIDDPGGQSPTMADALLVTLDFTAGATEGPTTVDFRYHEPPSRFTDESGGGVLPCLIGSPAIIIDGTGPVVTCPPDATIECDESTDPSNTGTATATDNLDPDPTIAFSDSVDPGSCPQESVITRTWTATDCAGNSHSCDQIITVVDTTAPVLFVPIPVTIECDEPIDPSNTGQATATDNCDPDPVIAYTDVVDLSGCGGYTGTITRTWTATDACGNSTSLEQIITLVDTTVPVFFVPIPVTIECDESSDPDDTGWATATDNCDASPTVTYSDSTVPGPCPQESVITRTWTAADACGNSTSLDQVITVVDTTAPVIVCPPDTTIPCGDPADPSETGTATATDNCDPAPMITYSDSSSGGCPTLIIRTWTATDACDNFSSCEQLIHGECAVSVTVRGCAVPPMRHDCQGRVVRMTFEYTGEGCAASNHNQSPTSVSCTGDAGMTEPVRILITNGAGAKVYADVSNVYLGETVVADSANVGENRLDPHVRIRIYDAADTLLEECEFHASCSQPLNIGDQFGSLLVVAMTTTLGGEVTIDDLISCITNIPGTLPGADVEYTYVITNHGGTTITDVTVIDDVFGEVPGSPIASIEPGESVTLTLTVFVSEETTNTVTVVAHVSNVECTDTATTTITIGLADCDSDGDTDWDDLQRFVDCLTGPGGGLLTDCECVDLDNDLDVDLADFAAFQRAFTGSL